MNDTVFIYTLNCPTSGRIRYVGKTVNPDTRLGQHVAYAHQRRTHRDYWILGLMTRGLQPVFEILDECSATEWEGVEREYIRVFRLLGMPLTNVADGGDGASAGSKLSEEHRNRIAASRQGKKRAPFSEEWRRKLSVAGRGREKSLETREKLRKANTGKILSEEHKKKMSVAMTGRKATDETRAKLSAVHRGRQFSEEHRRNLSAAQIGRKYSKETLAKMSESQLKRNRSK